MGWPEGQAANIRVGGLKRNTTSSLKACNSLARTGVESKNILVLEHALKFAPTLKSTSIGCKEISPKESNEATRISWLSHSERKRESNFSLNRQLLRLQLHGVSQRLVDVPEPGVEAEECHGFARQMEHSAVPAAA